MRILVDVYDAAGGQRLGEGPILTASSASVRRALDAAGSITLDAPAVDRRVQDLLQNERQVRIWIEEAGRMREMGSGRIRNQKLTVGGASARLAVSGPDALGDLARRSVLLNRAYDDAADEVAADLVGIAPGWTLSAERAASRWVGRFDGMSALRALVTLAEQKGLHFRLGLAPKLVEWGAFGSQIDVQAVGAGAATLALARDMHVLVIDRLEEVRKSQDIVNWLLPLGGGEAAVTLALSTRAGEYNVRTLTGPDGATLYYLRDDSSAVQYGDEIQKVLKLSQIKSDDMGEAAQINVANTLYDAAAAWLKRNAFEQTSYRFSAPRPGVTIRPGDRLRLTYVGEVYADGMPARWVEIDDWFWVLSVTETASDSGVMASVEVSTIDQQEQEAPVRLVKTMERLEVLEFEEVTIPSVSYPKRATLWHDEALVVVGTTLLTLVNASQKYYTYTQLTTPADGDSWTQGFFLAAGSYTLSFLYVQGTSGGKVDWYIDDLLVVSQLECYAAATTWNVLQTASVSVLTSGAHVLKGIVNGKHASSAGYFAQFTKMWLAPSAD